MTRNLRQEDHAEVVANAIANCSFSSGSGKRTQDLRGVVCWIACVVRKKSALYARELAEIDALKIDKEVCRSFISLSAEEMQVFFPSSHSTHAVTLENLVISTDKVEAIKANFQKFIDYESEDEEDDDDDEEEDEDD